MTTPLAQSSRVELTALETSLSEQLEAARQSGLSLDLTRGKPSSEQLDLCAGLESALNGETRDDSGTDLRNYGGLDGLPAAKALFAEMMEVEDDEILIGGNSSLTLMYFAALFANSQGNKAWNKEGNATFICPVPGYDRHFSLCQHLGINMVTVAIGDDGPDMDAVEALVSADPMIKGIWCVPRFSNPTGTVYSAAVVERLAQLPNKAGPGFKVFCDNAYAVHALTADAPALPSVMAAFKAAGTADALYLFGSTSKITYAGAGVGFVAMSPANLAEFKGHLGMSQIGPDKLNQQRHVRVLKNADGLADLMKRHGAILKPRFDIVIERLQSELDGLDIARWTEPKGGYFVSLDTQPGLAKTVVELAASAGVKLTPAGATFPYGDDPEDRNIRIAPSVPTLPEITQAMAVLTTCVKLASVRSLLATAAP